MIDPQHNQPSDIDEADRAVRAGYLMAAFSPDHAVPVAGAALVDGPMRETIRTLDGLTLGQRLRKLRTDSGKTLTQVANSIEVNQGMVSNWEVDRVCPNVYHFASLAEHFDVSMDYLWWDQERAQ